MINGVKKMKILKNFSFFFQQFSEIWLIDGYNFTARYILD